MRETYPAVVLETLDATDRRDRNVLVPEVLFRDAHHVADRDRVDRGFDLLRREAATRSDDLATDVFGDGGGAVEAEQERRLELRLGAGDLGNGGTSC